MLLEMVGFDSAKALTKQLSNFNSTLSHSGQVLNFATSKSNYRTIVDSLFELVPAGKERKFEISKPIVDGKSYRFSIIFKHQKNKLSNPKN